ncbi:TPA: hypothetical protein QEL15_001957 [Stenotrophomonas maltophilia]|nr:hypothetical protein [Stenotrophomonas maltophilia]
MALSKASHPQIDASNPWAGDPLARQREGEVLASLISTLGDSPFVISLKGGWGTGKSVFLRRFGAHLEGFLKIPVVHIDAWQSDYVDDPLLIMASALGDRLEEIQDGRVARGVGAIVSGLAGSAGKITLPVLSVLASALLPGGAKAVELAAAMPQIAQSFLDWDGERKSAESDFRNSLIKAKEKLHKSLKSEADLPVVIVVDELDRCRPDFAIKFLERMKHFFSVDGICFLIATDYENLPNAVESVYGPKVAGELYLRKFFDFEYNLPAPAAEDHAIYLFSAFPDGEEPSRAAAARKKLLAIHGYQELFGGPRGTLDQAEYTLFFGWTASAMELQLRDTLQAHTLLMAFVRSYPKGSMRFPFVDCFIACMRFRDPDHFRKLVTIYGQKRSIAANLTASAKTSGAALAALSRFMAIRHNASQFEFENEVSQKINDYSKDRMQALAYASLLMRARENANHRERVLTVDVEKYLRDVINLSAAFSQDDAGADP